ncbi:30S ribosomal protein S5 [Cardinium endosymbiont of Culicoides punctatus]|uniref:30S ribosomal protein S5 n=1 Tax=Cardinium endosymbiont of Culicoides punctatus TaxID=2304601 RepID=UPI0010D63013|nr:30S ribosomal protein S5 [Cardinium endosymbiont of Culicoides punctatus]TDG95321.1 30S ribosomal protein S5 [Cardinium endosymbiont of Culicoides punctatus]
MISGSKRLKASDYNLEERVVAINRVTKVVEGGRSFSSAAVVVVGNGDGVVGYGLGKAKELTDAIAKGVEEAKRNLIKVPILRETIPHDAVGKYGGGNVLIRPAASGTGVIAGGGVRIVLESAGIKNVLSKSQGSSNPHNVVKATFKALLQLRDPLTIAKQRGISLEKVFNG